MPCEEITLRVRIRNHDKVRMTAQVESGPDPTARWTEIPALRRNDEPELFRSDKIQRSGQAIKASLQHSVVLSIVARVTIQPKQAAWVLDSRLQVLPSDRTLLYPVPIGINEVVSF